MTAVFPSHSISIGILFLTWASIGNQPSFTFGPRANAATLRVTKSRTPRIHTNRPMKGSMSKCSLEEPVILYLILRSITLRHVMSEPLRMLRPGSFRSRLLSVIFLLQSAGVKVLFYFPKFVPYGIEIGGPNFAVLEPYLADVGYARVE